MHVNDKESPFHTMYGTRANDGIMALYSDSTIYGREGDDVLYSVGGNNVFYCGSGNDGAHGCDGNEIFYGDEGIDTFWAGNGDDVLDGGTTYDWLFGEGGNDTYILYKGCGNDIIEDGAGSNVIKFTDDTRPEDLIVRQNGDNVTIQLGNNGDIISLIKFTYNCLYNDFTLEFADGTRMHVNDKESPFSELF